MDEVRFPKTGDFSPSPSIRLTVTGGRIAGDRDAGLYPVADACGAAVGNLVSDRKLVVGEVVEAAEVPPRPDPRDPPVAFNGHPYHYMRQ